MNEILFEIAAHKRCFVRLKYCIQTVAYIEKRGLMGSAPAAFADKFVYERRGALRAWRHACGASAPQSSGGFDAGTCAPVLRIQTWLRIAASHAWLRRISFLRCSAVPCVFPCIGEKNLLYCLHAKPPAKGVLHKRLLREIRRIYGQIRNRRLAGNHCR